jgi:hypothetical protein
LRARIFLREEAEYRYGGELDAADADDVWRQLAMVPERNLKAGDVIYIGDVYLELNPDGGWMPLAPGALTRRLYQLAVSGETG